MDKDKLLEWLKRLYSVKERLVFGLVASVLAFRVYQILYGGFEDTTERSNPDPMEIPGIELPPQKVQKPVPPLVEWQPIYVKPDMFTERDRDSGPKTEQEDRMQDFTLDSIQMSGGKPMAFIRKKDGKSYFVYEGGVFESDFTVTAIDAVGNTVDVRDSETNKVTTLSIPEEKK